MRKLLKLFIITVILSTNIMAEVGIDVNTGTSEKVTNSMVVDLNTINRAVGQLKLTSLKSPDLDKIFAEYHTTETNQKTITFKIGKIFQSKITCEGIQANLDDIIPVFVKIIKTALLQIPAYAFKQIMGFDYRDPAAIVDFVVEFFSMIVCSGYAIAVTAPEQTLLVVSDFLAKSFSTFSTEADVQEGTVQSGAGKATNVRGQTPAVNKNAAKQSKEELKESAAEEFSSKINDCIDASKKFYNEVITANIKNFTPFKVEKKKSFCEMAKKLEKKKPAREFAIQSPIKFHATKNKTKSHKICYSNPFIKSCKKVDDINRVEAKTQLNEEELNQLIFDKGPLLDVSRDLPVSNLSLPILEDGILLIDTLNKCLNEPTANICERISCTGAGALDVECQRQAPNVLSPRERAIPFSLTPPNGVDFAKIGSKLMKLRQKKLICLQIGVMSDEEKINFLNELFKIISPSHLDIKDKQTVVALFEDIFQKEFCEYQFEQQIEEYEIFTRNRFRIIEQTFINSHFKNQITNSKFKELKADFTPGKITHPDGKVVDMCTWYEENTEKPQYTQDYTTILVESPITGERKIAKIDLSSIPANILTKHVAHTQPSFPVFGVCANSSCSSMNCVYNCKQWECENRADSPYTAAELDNTFIDDALSDYKTIKPENKKFGPDEIRAKKTVTEYIDEIENARISSYNKTYNLYHNYEEKFSRKVMIPMLKRQEFENSLFIY